MHNDAENVSTIFMVHGHNNCQKTSNLMADFKMIALNFKSSQLLMMILSMMACTKMTQFYIKTLCKEVMFRKVGKDNYNLEVNKNTFRRIKGRHSCVTT